MTIQEDAQPGWAAEFRELCQGIGFIVLNWAVLEQQLDNWVNVSFHNCGGGALRKGEGVPRALKQKTKFIIGCLKGLSPLSDFRDEGSALIIRINRASTQRHNLVHGAITEMQSTNGTFRFRKIGYEGDTHTVTEFDFSDQNFQEFVQVLSNLVTDSIAFSDKLANRFLT